MQLRETRKADKVTESELFSAEFLRNVVLILLSTNNTQPWDKGNQRSQPSSHLFNSFNPLILFEDEGAVGER